MVLNKLVSIFRLLCVFVGVIQFFSINVLCDAENEGVFKPKNVVAEVSKTVVRDVPLYQLAQQAGPYVRLAGVLGASATILGAYGAHRTYPTEKGADLKKIFETANRFHFIHSLAILGVPLCRRPAVSGTFFILGISMFCGTCYYRALTGDSKFQRMAPIGGTFLILGWLSMVL